MYDRVRHLTFHIELPFDEVEYKTRFFWESNKNKSDIEKVEDLPGNAGKRIYVSQKPTLKHWSPNGSSWGQDYDMEIRRTPSGADFMVAAKMHSSWAWGNPLHVMKDLIKYVTGAKQKLKWLD